MTLVAVTSLRGSPGATALATALAARSAAGRRTLLLEADPDGGVLASRFRLRLQPCLTDLAGAARGGIDPDALWSFTQPLCPDLDAVVAHPGGEQTSAALRVAVGHLVPALGDLDADVVVDAGRLRSTSPLAALLHAADRVVVVLRPDLGQVMSILHGVEWFAGPPSLGLVVVGSRPYSARQVAEVTGIDVVGEVPDDAAAVAADPFAASTKRRAAWAGAVAVLAARLGLGSPPIQREGAAPAADPVGVSAADPAADPVWASAVDAVDRPVEASGGPDLPDAQGAAAPAWPAPVRVA